MVRIHLPPALSPLRTSFPGGKRGKVFLVTSSGRSAWFVGVLLLMVYLIFAMTLYLLPPRNQ